MTEFVVDAVLGLIGSIPMGKTVRAYYPLRIEEIAVVFVEVRAHDLYRICQQMWPSCLLFALALMISRKAVGIFNQCELIVNMFVGVIIERASFSVPIESILASGRQSSQ